MPLRHLWRLAAAGAVCALPALGASQETHFSFFAEGSVNFLSDAVEAIDEPGAELNLSDDTGSIEGRSFLDWGANKLYLQATGFADNNPPELLTVNGIGFWADQVTISNPELNGTRGTFTGSLRLDGNAFLDLSDSWENDASVEASASWRASMFIALDDENSSDGGEWSGQFVKGEGYSGDALNQVYNSGPMEFIYGEPFFLITQLEGNANILNPNLVEGSGTATLDMFNSATWNGILEFRDESGGLVTDVDLVSASGTDYLRPVPEPATMAALALGSIGLLARRRRR